MDLDEFASTVAQTLENVRLCLARIEEEAQVDDDPKWLALSRAYAMLVTPLRDYLTSHQADRPLPRQLGRRVSEAMVPLLDFEAEVARLGLHPNAEELGQLVRLAATAA